jgi:membrane associated rhomboid family serine protease
MIPLKDLNPSRSFPVVNIGLILANILVFIYQLTLPPRVLNSFFLANAVIPNHVPLSSPAISISRSLSCR